jgi:hypothetical protein
MEKRGRGKPVEIRRKPNRKVLPMWRKRRASGKGKAEKEKWNSSKDLCAISENCKGLFVKHKFHINLKP